MSRALSASRSRSAPEAVRALGALTADQRRRLRPLLSGLGLEDIRTLGYAWDPRARLWLAGGRPPHVAHTLLVSELFVSWVEAGHHPGTFRPEPRLVYVSPSGGRRRIDPDALVLASGEAWAVEVDRATEGPGALARKWWRYREFMREVGSLAVLVVAPPGRLETVRATLRLAGLRAALAASPREAVAEIARSTGGVRSG